MRPNDAAGRAVIEPLDPRLLFSAEVVNTTLVVTGSAGPDRISLYHDATDKGPVIVVIVDRLLVGAPPEVDEIPSDGVRAILVRAGAGDDTVDLFNAPTRPTTSPISLPTRIDAGLGDDRATGGRGRDFILGGFGDDQINGIDGADWIDGGWGDDVLRGGAGNDYVSGGYGNDDVYGNEGDDRLSGGPGNDHVGFNGVGPLASEPGNDVLSGGSGEDWMVGGSGKDRIVGGTGRDHWSLEDDDTEMLDRTPDEPKDVPINV